MTRDSRETDSSSQTDPEFDELLSQVLLALGPYRADLILIGGWVPYLYQRFGGFPQWRIEILRTVELDLVVPSPLTTAARPTLAEILHDAGFETTSGGAGAIWIRKAKGEEMIEFFTSHTGTARRLGKARRIVGQADLAGISLQHLSLLTDKTNTLQIRTAGKKTIDVRVPTLGGYVLNKALTFMDRLSAPGDRTSKAAKDVVYMRDVMAGGESVRHQVRADIELLVNRNKPRQNLLRTASDRHRQLKTSQHDVLDSAASQLATHHRIGSEDAAEADLTGYIDILSDLLNEIGQRPRRSR